MALFTPRLEQQALKVLQEARYVHAQDTTAVPVVEKLLRDMGFSAAADRFVAGDTELLADNAARIRKAQGLMRAFGVQGVPALVVTDDSGSHLLRGDALYGSLDSLLSHNAQA